MHHADVLSIFHLNPGVCGIHTHVPEPLLDPKMEWDQEAKDATLFGKIVVDMERFVVKKRHAI